MYNVNYFVFNKLFGLYEFLAQWVWASPSGLCRAERHSFEFFLTQYFVSLLLTLYCMTLAVGRWRWEQYQVEVWHPSPALKSSHPELLVASQWATIVQPASGSRDNSNALTLWRTMPSATSAPPLCHHCATAAPPLGHRCTPVLTDEDSTNPPVPQVASQGKSLTLL